MPTHYNLNVIGTVTSPFQEKFAIPRQPGLATAAKGQVLLQGMANNPELVHGLDAFSHIWLIFIFHGNNIDNSKECHWKALVRPPRLGGNKKMGVLATRSPFRPNPLGMSVVKLDSIVVKNKQTILNISGLDLLHGTPIIDIKPYIPYSDAVSNVKAGFAQEPPNALLSINFSTLALTIIKQYETIHPELELLITQILRQDPRPAYKQNKKDDKVYGMSLYNLNIQWRMTSISTVTVVKIEPR